MTVHWSFIRTIGKMQVRIHWIKSMRIAWLPTFHSGPYVCNATNKKESVTQVAYLEVKGNQRESVMNRRDSHCSLQKCMSNRPVKISRLSPIVNWFFDITFVMSTSTIVVARVLNMLRIWRHRLTEALSKVVVICYGDDCVHDLLHLREFCFSLSGLVVCFVCMILNINPVVPLCFCPHVISSASLLLPIKARKNKQARLFYIE